MATIKGIRLSIGGDTSELTSALKGVNKEIKGTQSELREVDRLLKIDPNNTELLAQKQKLLGDNVEETKNKLEKLKIAGEQASNQLAKGDIGEDQFRALQREIVKTEQSLEKAETKASEFGQKAKMSFSEVGGAIKGLGEGMSKYVTAPLAGGLVAVTKGTEELRGDLSKLDQNARDAGKGIEETRSQLRELYALTGEEDSSIEALSNLLQSGFDDNQMQIALENLSGAVVKFPDTLKIEGLADSIEETLATGKGVGMFGELLERLGYNLDDFNLGLEEAKTKGAETDYVLQALAGTGLAKTNAEWEKNNQGLKNSAESQLKLKESLATLGETLTPVITAITDLIGGLVERFNNLDSDTQKTILTILGLVASIGPLLVVVGTVIQKTTAIIGFLPKLTGLVKTVFTLLKANPIGIIIAVIGLVVAKLIHLYKTNAEFKAKVDEVWGAVKDKISSVVESIKSKIGSIVSAFKNLPSKMKEIGSNIINGIKEGILGGITAIKNAVSTVINKVKGFFTGKDGFDIHSPSKWAEKQGYFIDLGLEKGITKGKEKVKKSASDVSKDIMSGLTEFVDNKKFYDKITLEQELEFWKQMKKIKQLKTSEINEINKKIYTASKEISENEKREAEEFNQSIESKAKSLQNFAGLFDKINKESTVTGAELLKNLQDQVNTFEEWQKSIGELEGKGLGNALIEELKEKGPSAHQEIKALLQLSDAELKTYSDTYAKKISLTLSNAIKQVTGLPFAELQTSLGDMVENAKFATSAEVKQEQTVFIADAVGQSLLYGLQAISGAIFDALPKDVQLNIDGRKFARYNWSYLDREGYSRGRIFAPSENTIANIARSVMPKGEEKK